MKQLAKLVSYVCLLLTLVPSFLVYYGYITLDLNKLLMLVGTIGWFITASFWMNEPKDQPTTDK